MPYTQVSNLDFTEIKVALKDYLRSQTDFTDFDFEGSVWSNLLDVLAYNTYYTAFNTNMVVNELFLNSATLRDNVVALAKQLGYKPKSKTAPSSSIDFTVTFTGSSPDSIILKKGTGFVTTFDDNIYQYVAIEDTKATVSNSIATFNNVKVYEGSLVTNFYTVNTALENQRFVIQNPSVDTNTIKVKVYSSSESSFYETYELSTNILNVTPSTKAYFLEEIEDEKYEIFFGDGIIGRKLQNNEYIEISYLTTNGPSTNGAFLFTFSGVLEDANGNSSYPIQVSNIVATPSNGGEDIESISKIKFNAPKYFGTQDRAVTSQDYAAIVRNIYPAIADIIVFGGEENNPPEYGKVKISIKPKNTAFLSSSTKKEIQQKLKPYMVASVTPDIVDPSIVYLELVSKIYYDRSKTTDNPEVIKSKVIQNIEDYLKQSETEKFGGKFKYSKTIAVIDNADKSIVSNDTEIVLRKDFYPALNSTFFYEICFLNSFDKDCEGPTISSTGFTLSEYPNYTVYLEDRDGKIVIYRLDPLTGSKIVINNEVGIIDYEKGELRMNNLTIIKGSFFDNRIEIRAKPLSRDISAFREMYLDVDVSQSKFTVYSE